MSHALSPALGDIQETLLIPLYFRALETVHSRPIIRDTKAMEIVRALDYDFTRFASAWPIHMEVAVRTEVLDEQVSAFLCKHPEAIVVNLGAGLDGRFERLDNGSVTWFELDLPDSLALRERFFPPSARNRFLSGSMLDFAWMDRVERLDFQPVLIIAEGLFCYFNEAEVRSLFLAVAERLPGAELLFQSVAPWVVGRQRSIAGLNRTRAALKWGIRRGKDVEAWDSRIHVVDEWYLIERHRERWRWLRYARWFPPASRLLREVWKITHVRFDDATSRVA